MRQIQRSAMAFVDEWYNGAWSQNSFHMVSPYFSPSQALCKLKFGLWSSSWDHGQLCAGLHCCSPAHTNDQLSQKRIPKSRGRIPTSPILFGSLKIDLCCNLFLWLGNFLGVTTACFGDLDASPTLAPKAPSKTEVPWHVPPTTSNVRRAPNAALRRSGCWVERLHMSTSAMGHGCFRIIWIHC